MRVGQKFETNGCILQVIFSVVFYHPRAFDPWDFFGKVRSVVEEREDNVFLSSSLKSVVFRVAKATNDWVALFLESVVGIKFNNLDRKKLRPSVIHINTAIIVDKNVGVAVSVTVECGSLGPNTALGIGR